jgi:hypothetical protein
MRYLNFAGNAPPRVIDGALYVAWASFTAFMGYLAQKESYEYIDPWVRFYAIGILTPVVAGVGALKAFRAPYKESADPGR